MLRNNTLGVNITLRVALIEGIQDIGFYEGGYPTIVCLKKRQPCIVYV